MCWDGLPCTLQIFRYTFFAVKEASGNNAPHILLWLRYGLNPEARHLRCDPFWPVCRSHNSGAVPLSGLYVGVTTQAPVTLSGLYVGVTTQAL